MEKLTGLNWEQCYNNAINFIKRGVNTYIGTALDMPIGNSVCVGCGQCVLHCPTGALEETYEIQPVLDAINTDLRNIVNCNINDAYFGC